MQTLKTKNQIYAIITTMLFALLLFFALAFQGSVSLFDNSMTMMASKIYQVELLINVPVKTDSAQTNKTQNHDALSQVTNRKSMTNMVPLFKSHRTEVAEGDFSIGSKIEGQMAKRGWSKSDITDTINNPSKTVETRDVRWQENGAGRNNEPATAYVRDDGHYVVRNDNTGDIVQVSNRLKPGWKSPF